MTILPVTHRFTQMERVLLGRPVAVALADELALLGARRVLLITARSLANSTALDRLRAALADRLAATYAGVLAHSPRACVVEGARAARACGADLLVAVGGGSVIDAAKAMLLMLRHGYDTPDALEPHANRLEPDRGRRPADADRWLRVVAVPTTLSGAEFASSAGLTDPARGLKHGFSHPMMIPVSVILDPAMALTAPRRLLLGTGVKSLDHAVERITSANANPYSDAVSVLALRLLAGALPRLRDGADLQAHADAQTGMFMSLAGSASGVAVNVSHAIGHVLGAHVGVPHGETSCVLLPATLRWSLDACAERQAIISEALGAPGGDAADTVAALVASLDLPTRLRDVGVRREDLPLIAAKTMHERLLRNSRKPVDGPDDIARILELAW